MPPLPRARAPARRRRAPCAAAHGPPEQGAAGAGAPGPALRVADAAAAQAPADAQWPVRARVERPHRDEQEEALGVGRSEEQRAGEDREEEQRGRSQLAAQLQRRQPMEHHERRQEGGQRHQIGRDQKCAVGAAAELGEAARKQRVEREERRAHIAVGVSRLGDPEVPDAVPAGERRQQRVAKAAQRMRERRLVELLGVLRRQAACRRAERERGEHSHEQHRRTRGQEYTPAGLGRAETGSGCLKLHAGHRFLHRLVR